MTAPAPSGESHFQIGDLPLGPILDEALALTKRHGWKAALVGIVPLLPLSIAKALFDTWAFHPDAGEWFFQAFLIDWAWTAFYGGMLYAPLIAGMYYLLATACLGKPATPLEGFRLAARCWIWVAPAYVVLMPLVYAGFALMCYVPGVLMSVALYLHLAVMALDRMGPFAAMGRGFSLMRGRIGAIFIVVCAEVFLHVTIGSMTFIFGWNCLIAVATPFLHAPVSLYFAAVTVVIYISARSRHESIDLQLLADEIAAEAGEPEAARL